MKEIKDKTEALIKNKQTHLTNNRQRIMAIEQTILQLMKEKENLTKEQKSIEEEIKKHQSEMPKVNEEYSIKASAYKSIEAALCELNIDVLMKEETTMDIEQSIKELEKEKQMSINKLHYYQNQVIREIQKRIL